MFCRECGVSIENDSQFCRLCGKAQVDLSEDVADPENQSGAAAAPSRALPTWAFVLAGAFVLLVIVGSLTPKSAPQPSALSSPPDALASGDLNSAAPVALPSSAPTAEANWSYTTDTDKVRGGITYFASTTSTNTVPQSAPYDSNTSMTVTVRNSPGAGLNILVQISSGQLMCSSYESCSGTVRFDDGPAETVSFIGSDDNDSQTMFVRGESSFLAKLKRAKRLIIEKTLYQAGAPQFEFDVHGLKWDH